MTENTSFRPRRSCLYMPGANPRALDKARDLPADMLILDLEDAVAPESKADARQLVADTIAGKPYGQREIVVRINDLSTDWAEADLAMLAGSDADGVLVPKVTSGAEIEAIDARLDALGASQNLGLWVMIEMPLAILNIQEVAAAGASTRLRGFMFGPNDLAKEMDALPTPGRTEFLTALSMTVMAARAYGLVALDGVFNDFKDDSGLRAECEQGRSMGFDGKTLIHPAQIETTNQVFSPAPEALSRAEAVIAAFALPENQGKGAIQVDGKLTELLHLEQAKKLVAIDQAIKALSQQ